MATTCSVDKGLEVHGEDVATYKGKGHKRREYKLKKLKAVSLQKK